MADPDTPTHDDGGFGSSTRVVVFALVGLVALAALCGGVGLLWLRFDPGPGGGGGGLPAGGPGLAPGGDLAVYERVWLPTWRDRLDRFDDEQRELVEAMAAATPAGGEDDQALARMVDGLAREQVVERFLVSALGADGAAAEPPSPEVAQRWSQVLEQYGTFVQARTPRTSSGVLVKGGVVHCEEQLAALFTNGMCDVRVELVWAPDEGWSPRGLAVTFRVPAPGDPVPSAGPDVPVSEGEAAGARIMRQTCEQCGALRFGRTGQPWQIAVARAGDPACGHAWTSGASRGARPAILDGHVVLVRRRGALGAFMLRDQRGGPDRTSVDWVLRTDGGDSLDPSDAAVESGSAEEVAVIAFGPFRIQWSIAEAGEGWLYYERAAGAPIDADTPRICITDATSFADVDPDDPRWVYRASASDEGVRGRDD